MTPSRAGGKALYRTAEETAARSKSMKSNPQPNNKFVFRKLGRFSPANLSIKHRLPLLMCTLLFVVLLASTWASYHGVKTSALEAGRERLLHLTDQLAGMFQQSSNSLTTKMLAVANEPAIRTYINSPSPTSRSSAVELLQQFAPPKDSNSLAVELWSVNQTLVLSIPESTLPVSNDLETEFKQTSSAPFKAFGTLRAVKDTVAYPAVVAVRDDAGRPGGYLVRWRKAAATPETQKQFMGLIGSKAKMYFGNNQGDLWSDLVNIAPKPPVDVRSTTEVSQYARDGKSSVMAIARPISGTPWFILLEFPDEAFTAQANRFLWRKIVISVALLALAWAGALVLSRTITQPLEVLTNTASAITAGDKSRLVNIKTHDEFGKLATAFNEMVLNVRDSHRELERKVQQRTSELEEANMQLQALSESNVLKRSEAEKEKTEAVQALRSSEQQLQQSQKLEAVGRLAGGIAHDFNNLLTVIMGYSTLLMRSNLENGVYEKIEEINKAADRASSLTRQLLAFSRKQVLKPKVIAVNSLVEGTSKMLQRLIGEDIEVNLSLKADAGKINADPGQIEQVLINLVVNARDAMKDGGKITIETANVELDPAYSDMHIAVSPGSYVMLAVSDTGTGMSAETRKQIFEPFFTTKEVGKGTGLGLSMVYGIVKQSGGNIWVYSEPGKGSTFKIYLPKVQSESSERSSAGNKSNVFSALATETILLVEDEEMVRNLTYELLREQGYQVLVAANGEEAIRICYERGTEQIDLMLTDVVMPEMNGRRLAETVCAVQPNMKVVYMSGYTDDAIVHHGVLEPGTNFIEKPFTAETLLTTIREVIEKPAPDFMLTNV
jgi:signal transduction histidine kinase/ActR/RegA family two-component response regulator